MNVRASLGTRSGTAAPSGGGEVSRPEMGRGRLRVPSPPDSIANRHSSNVISETAALLNPASHAAEHDRNLSDSGAGSIPEAPEDSPLRSVTERKESAIDMAQFFEKVFGRLKSKNATLPAATGPCNRLAVHFECLRDTEILKHFTDTLIARREEITGSTVLEIGCGIGLLSLICAKLGAKSVISVDSTPFVAVGEKVAVENGCADVIKFVSTLEEAQKRLNAAEGGISLIVSDWIGLGFFKGNLIASIVHARETLKIPRILFGHARLYICAISDDTHHAHHKRWKHAGEIDFRPLRDLDFTTPVYGHNVMAASVCSTSAHLHTYDLATLKVEKIGFTAEFCLRPSVPVPGDIKVPVTGLVIWSEISDEAMGDLCITTDPFATNTRYGQTTLCLPNPPYMERESELNGRLTFIPAVTEENDPVFVLEYAVDEEAVQEIFYGVMDRPTVLRKA